MTGPETETVVHNGTELELTYFNVPMLHEDFHKAERMGLVYSHYDHQGPDYWDDAMVFCKPEHKEIVEAWRNSYMF